MQPTAWQSGSCIRLWRLRSPFCTESALVSHTVLMSASFATMAAKQAVMMCAEPCHGP